MPNRIAMALLAGAVLHSGVYAWAATCAELSDEGERLIDQNRVDEAQSALEKAVAICATPAHERGARPFLALGMIYHRRQRYPDAIKQFEEALKVEPGEAQAYINLCAVYTDMGRYEQAIEAGTKGLGGGNDHWEMLANYNIGLAYVKWAADRQDTTDHRMIPFFEKSMKLDPDFGANPFYLGVVKETMEGDLPAAKRFYDKSCSLHYEQACQFLREFDTRTSAYRTSHSTPSRGQ